MEKPETVHVVKKSYKQNKHNALVPNHSIIKDSSNKNQNGKQCVEIVEVSTLTLVVPCEREALQFLQKTQPFQKSLSSETRICKRNTVQPTRRIIKWHVM